MSKKKKLLIIHIQSKMKQHMLKYIKHSHLMKLKSLVANEIQCLKNK